MEENCFAVRVAAILCHQMWKLEVSRSYFTGIVRFVNKGIKADQNYVRNVVVLAV